MKTVHVHYQGWGENWPLGTLADDGQQLLFEYSPQALVEGLSLSPMFDDNYLGRLTTTMLAG